MAERSDSEKRTLVREACESAFAHEFIEKLPAVPIPMPLMFNVAHGT
jgi:hypothetical protein